MDEQVEELLQSYIPEERELMRELLEQDDEDLATES